MDNRVSLLGLRHPEKDNEVPAAQSRHNTTRPDFDSREAASEAEQQTLRRFTPYLSGIERVLRISSYLSFPF